MEIQAAFTSQEGIREASRKLEMLRAAEIRAGEDGMLTAVVDDTYFAQALAVISGAGGTVEG
ncbi:hypothetical protein ACLBWT_02460 [Paenibacillus sp. D51F]